MGGLRADGLPHPVDGTQEYLAAILDELRGLRVILSPQEPAATDEPPRSLQRVTEPQAATAPDAVKAPAAEPAESAGKGEDRSPLPPPDPDIDRVVDEGRVTKPKPKRTPAKRSRARKAK